MALLEQPPRTAASLLRRPWFGGSVALVLIASAALTIDRHGEDGPATQGAGEPEPVAVQAPPPPADDPGLAARESAEDALPGNRRVTHDPAQAAADPAMLFYVPPGAAVPASPPATGSPQPSPAAHTRARLDEESGRLFLPGEGWLSTDELRDLYMNRPQDIPAGIDLQQLHQIIASRATVAGAPGTH